MSSLLPGLGALGPRMVKATAEGIIVASTHQWGVCVGEVPVNGGVGWDGRESAAQHWEVELSACCSIATRRCHLASCSRSLVFQVQRVRDVLEPAGGGRHVVGHSGEAQGARSPMRVSSPLTGGCAACYHAKLLPLELELCLSGL
jgi:hypothetical protein